MAVFGGSFNPPHVAHLLAAVLAIATGGASKVLVVPTFRHPFAKPLASFEHRVRMCELCMAGHPQIEVSRVEQELGGESRTLRLVEHVRATSPDVDLRLLVGADILLESAKWHGWEAICAVAPPMVLGRVGALHPDAPVAVLPDVSSTRVRQLLTAREADGDTRERELGALVPRDVLAYARAHSVYVEGP
ncbi:MAG TPA: nicotinate-nicotinamide nucleotide adenylyltransferase [Polyangiaceae bacterium]|nr:nicotinate-nicotinamide nucleotide adenylyltransferase [Polyangiaceae bacterium]